MNVIGDRQYPCHHATANAPTEPGTFVRRCRTCNARHTLIVELAPVATAKCGSPVYRARWKASDDFANAVREDH